ncbi:hypothetical protein IT882_12865 [Microbacterium schleiferi]|uniref:Helix-turn-helix domain-containing protein n=1 Tax=Microbacterium schleiferi TaxID=69362 RepID=A0A7S8MVT4_9MICO|nr:hypothetical protein [Microbacterium schleiferi]QPE04089.1 hypothetical protein IT882_12865 [Microbacterium schleiferi]
MTAPTTRPGTKKEALSGASFFVEPLNGYSNNSLLLPPQATELSKLAAAAARMPDPAAKPPPPPHRLSRRLSPETCAEIAEKCRAGATTPSLCAEYGISKGGLLRLLRDRGVEMRRQPLAPEHVEQAAALYRYGFSIAAIASYLDASYNNVRQNFVRLGIERRPRGGSQPVSGRVNHSTLDEQQGMAAVLLYIAGGPLETAFVPETRVFCCSGVAWLPG